MRYTIIQIWLKQVSFICLIIWKKGVVEEWLRVEGFKENEIKLIWEFLGGCPYNIVELLSDRRGYGEDFNLKEYLIHQAEIVRGRISLTVSRDFSTVEEKRYFKEMLREIIERGYIEKKDEDDMQDKVLRIGIEKDILFLYSDKGIIKFNSQIMKKGAEVYLGVNCSKKELV